MLILVLLKCLCGYCNFDVFFLCFWKGFEDDCIGVYVKVSCGFCRCIWCFVFAAQPRTRTFQAAFVRNPRWSSQRAASWSLEDDGSLENKARRIKESLKRQNPWDLPKSLKEETVILEILCFFLSFFLGQDLYWLDILLLCKWQLGPKSNRPRHINFQRHSNIPCGGKRP